MRPLNPVWGCSAHEWSKHGLKNTIRKLVWDESRCRVCGCEFHTRARLLKHLGENRVRAKNRAATCAEVWRQDFPEAVPQDELERLEKVVAEQVAADRKKGRRHVVATKVAVPTAPTI